MRINKTQPLPERHFRQGNKVHVFQRGFEPPCYLIFPPFEGLKKLFADLELPAGADQVFYSKFISGGDFTRTLGRVHEENQKYTVELIGLLIPTSDHSKKTKPPDARQYSTLPKYWYESTTELVQIWRTRVFRSKLFTPLLTNPLTPHRPTFPYLEEAWHPDRPDTSITFGGLERFFVGFSLLDHFYGRTRQILTGRSATVGRPRGSGFYESAEEFYREVKKVYRELAVRSGRRPLQKEVAQKMNLKLKTFRKYWTRVGRLWSDLYEIVMGQTG